MALTNPYDEMPIDERLKNKQKAYDSAINVIQPMQQAKRTATMTPIGLEGLRGVYKGATEGGFMGRQAASTAVDQAQLEMAKAAGGLNKQQDALNLEGAQMKEDIVGTRQQESLNQFKRGTADMEAKMDKALAERSFELGMSAKELTFHTNARIADIGIERMVEDYNNGNIGREELETLKGNLARSAQQDKLAVEALLREIQRTADDKRGTYSRARAMELQAKVIEKLKEAAKKQAKAGNIAAIISGTMTIGGAVTGAVIGSGAGPAGTLAGASAGAAIGGGLAPSVNNAYGAM